MMLATLVTLFSLSQPVLAQDEFVQHKADFLADLDKRISLIQKLKACAEASKSKEDMQKCHATMKTDQQAMAEHNRGERLQEIDKRMQKLEEKKKEIETKKNTVEKK